MHPYVVEQMVQERQAELARLAHMAHLTSVARREAWAEVPAGAGRWRALARLSGTLAAAAGLLTRRGRPLEPCPGETARRW